MSGKRCLVEVYTLQKEVSHRRIYVIEERASKEEISSKRTCLIAGDFWPHRRRCLVGQEA